MNAAVFRDTIWSLVVGVTQTRLYSASHETVPAAARRLLSLLAEYPGGRCSLMVVKGDLVFNAELFRDAGMHGEKLVRMLGEKGISRVDFMPGIDEEELCRFFVDLSRPKIPPARYAHVRIGSVEAVRQAAAAGPAAPVAAEEVAQARRVLEEVSPFREVPTGGVEEVVAGFLLSFRRGAGLLQMISPVKSYSEHTYSHAVNVSILSMAMGERLGLKDQTVQDIGVAGLMHDVGKLLIPKEILHKDGKLSAEEFGKIKQHTLYGAAYLARAEGLTPLAILAALEHHRKFDNSGYPMLSDNARRQHAASQIIAIADVYDALRSHRPYKRSMPMAEILGIMQKDAGTGFNPFLLRSFSAMMLAAAASP